MMEPCVQLPLEPLVLDETVAKARDWAAVHGLVLRVKESLPTYRLEIAPFTLLPSPFSNREYFKAKQIQTALNLLLHRVAHDETFLKNTLKNTVAVDDFTAKLFAIHETVLSEGRPQSVSLGIIRCDYLLDTSEDDTSPRIKQVEMNTISSSFSSLATRMSQMHRYILDDRERNDLTSAVLENYPTVGFAKALIFAWRVYNSVDAVVAFVVEPFVRMVGDHKQLECEILKQNPKVRVIRKTLKDFGQRGQLRNGALFIDGYEVAVVYFRDGYTPESHQDQLHWDARLLLERSRAIKCPSIQYQLAGTKKVQQELSRPEVLERFISDEKTTADVSSVFTGLYSLDEGVEGDSAVEMVKNDPSRFVLKPQREGGGNNLYGDDILKVLNLQKSAVQRSAYILMDRIVPPTTRNYLVRPSMEPVLTEVVSELGVYGIILGSESEILLNEEVGHLLRTKPSSSDEGGVVAGFACLDGMLLTLLAFVETVYAADHNIPT